MKTTRRVFIVLPGDNLRRISINQFDQLYRGEERLPEFAVERVRFAICLIAVDRRKPLSIVRIDWPVCFFDEHGCLVQSARELRFSVEAARGRVTMGTEKDQARAAMEQLDREFRWQPSPDLEARIQGEALCW